MSKLPPAAGAVLSGLIAVGVLSGMLVLHAWPLWTGQPIYLEVRPIDPRDLFRGDYVTLGYEAGTLQLRIPPGIQPPVPVRPPGGLVPPDGPAPPAFPAVDPIGTWWRPDPVTGGYTRGQLRRTLYVQLRPEPSTLAGVPVVHVPVSLADRPVEGAINLAGRTFVYPDTYTYRLDYGIDALFVREGTGRPIESAIRDNDTPVYAEVLVTRSGTARVRALIINGQRTP